MSAEHTYSLFESKVSVSTCIFGEILLTLVIFINLAAKVDWTTSHKYTYMYVQF